MDLTKLYHCRGRMPPQKNILTTYARHMGGAPIGPNVSLTNRRKSLSGGRNISFSHKLIKTCLTGSGPRCVILVDLNMYLSVILSSRNCFLKIAMS